MPRENLPHDDGHGRSHQWLRRLDESRCGRTSPPVIEAVAEILPRALNIERYHDFVGARSATVLETEAACVVYCAATALTNLRPPPEVTNYGRGTETGAGLKDGRRRC